ERRGSHLRRERLAGGDPKLCLDQIEPGHELRDGMLDLKPSIHLQEERIAARIDEELDRTGAGIAGRAHEGERRVPERHPPPVAGLTREEPRGAGRLFDDFLMPPLHAAFALTESNE